MSDWQDYAACKGVPTDVFFTADSPDRGDLLPVDKGLQGGNLRAARKMCSTCPVWEYCRVSSLGEEDGYWAGVGLKRRRMFWGRHGLANGDSESLRIRAATAAYEAWLANEDPSLRLREIIPPEAVDEWMTPQETRYGVA